MNSRDQDTDVNANAKETLPLMAALTLTVMETLTDQISVNFAFDNFKGIAS